MRRGGFTLLEMIVVLAILGLATALVAPAALRGIDRWRRQAVVDGLLDQIRALPGRARASGDPIEVSEASLASKEPPLRIDGDWKLRVDRDWRVSGNGVCGSGEVVVANDYGERKVQVKAPFCDVAMLP